MTLPFKTWLAALWIALALGATLAPGAAWSAEKDKPGPRGSGEEVKKETAEAVDAARRHVVTVRKDFEQQMDEKLGQAKKRLEKWRGSVEKTGRKVVDESRETLKTVEEKQATAEKRLKALKGATQEAWKSLREGVEGAMEDLEKGLDSAEKPPTSGRTP